MKIGAVARSRHSFICLSTSEIRIEFIPEGETFGEGIRARLHAIICEIGVRDIPVLYWTPLERLINWSGIPGIGNIVRLSIVVIKKQVSNCHSHPYKAKSAKTFVHCRMIATSDGASEVYASSATTPGTFSLNT